MRDMVQGTDAEPGVAVLLALLFDGRGVLPVLSGQAMQLIVYEHVEGTLDNAQHLLYLPYLQ
jgi:hypothetical protein